MGYTIFLTGATGYLGSALCAALSRNHRVTGLFRRPPSERLRLAAPTARWEKGDVADRDCLDSIFKEHIRRKTPIDYIIHFAAFTDFGEKWKDEYCDTNVIGTQNIIEAAVDGGAGRILFAGSIAALNPRKDGLPLTEQSNDYADVAYSRSKALGEKLLMENAGRIPVVILRLGGVFTQWCELPPLFSVMNLWRTAFFGTVIPGRGLAGFPYIHRKDVVRMVERIIDCNQRLDRSEILLASHPGCTRQKELFPIIRKACSSRYATRPVRVSQQIAKIFLHAKYILNTILKKETYERPWMIRYVDRPLMVDTSYTAKKLNWTPDPELGILPQLPVLVDSMQKNYAYWLERNIKRNNQKYEYCPDD